VSYELSPERKKELIEKIAVTLVKNDFEDYALAFIEGSMPMSWVGSQLLTVAVFPFAPILGGWSEDLVTLMYDRKNIAELISRIKELSEEKKKNRVGDEGKKTWKDRVRNFIGFPRKKKASSSTESV
jgi:hypothetical protein